MRKISIAVFLCGAISLTLLLKFGDSDDGLGALLFWFLLLCVIASILIFSSSFRKEQKPLLVSSKPLDEKPFLRKLIQALLAIKIILWIISGMITISFSRGFGGSLPWEGLMLEALAVLYIFIALALRSEKSYLYSLLVILSTVEIVLAAYLIINTYMRNESSMEALFVSVLLCIYNIVIIRAARKSQKYNNAISPPNNSI